MILVNLLPYREAAHQRRRKAFQRALWLALLLGCLLAGLAQLLLQAQLLQQRARNQLLRAELEKMQVQVKSMEQLRADIALLQERRRMVENLQADRNLPTRILMTLAQKLPAAAYFTALRQDSQTITLQGVARDNETVSAFLRNMDQPSSWYRQVELQEIVAAHYVLLSLQKKVKEMNFSLRIHLRCAEQAPGAASPTTPAGRCPASSS